MTGVGPPGAPEWVGYTVLSSGAADGVAVRWNADFVTRAWTVEAEDCLKRDIALEWDVVAAGEVVRRLLRGADARAAARDFAVRRVALGASENDVDQDLLALATVWPDHAGVGTVVCDLREAAARGARQAATWVGTVPRLRESLTGLYNPHLLVHHIHQHARRGEPTEVLFVRWTPSAGVRHDTCRLAVAVAVMTFSTTADLAAAVGPSEIGLSSFVRDRHLLLLHILEGLPELDLVSHRVCSAPIMSFEGIARWLVAQCPDLLAEE